MCGRFALYSPAGVIRKEFSLSAEPEVSARYNLAPGQELLAIIHSGAAPVAENFRWGLVPFWAKDPAIGNRMINARAETVAEKPSFRQAYKRRRCLIPADGFYEWQAAAGGKQPWYIRAKEPALLAFAGLWESWEDADKNILKTCTIITTVANDFVRRLHARMPVMLNEAERQLWLAADTSAEDLQQLLTGAGMPLLTADAVSRKVNNPVNDEPGLIEPRP